MTSGSVQGPGLGNLRYEESEAFQVVSWVEFGTGLPERYRGRRPFGTNVGAMVNGYFVTVFAPDGAFGPGGFLVYDVSDLRNIRLVRRVYDPRGTTRKFREAHSLGIARVDGSTYVAVHVQDGVEFWDFSDVETPRDGATAQAPTTRVGVAFSDSVLLESARTDTIRLVMNAVHPGVASTPAPDAQFAVEAAGDGATYLWKFGDGTASGPSTNPTARHAYAAAGTTRWCWLWPSAAPRATTILSGRSRIRPRRRPRALRRRSLAEATWCST